MKAMRTIKRRVGEDYPTFVARVRAALATYGAGYQIDWRDSEGLAVIVRCG